MHPQVHSVTRVAAGQLQRVSRRRRPPAPAVTSVPMRRPVRRSETEIRPGLRAHSWFLLPGQAMPLPGAPGG
jgi:hypothetical protein